MTFLRSLVCIGALGAAVGCTAILDLGRFQEAATTAGDTGAPDTSLATDAGVDTGPEDPRFACLKLPNQTLDTGQVSLQLAIANVTKQQVTPGSVDGGTDTNDVYFTGLPGVTMEACLGLDPACANPVNTPAQTDDGGIVNFTISANFTGFFRGTGDQLVPFNFFPGPWPAGVPSATYVTGALRVSDEVLLNSALNDAVDLDAGSGLGELFVVVFDCLDHHLAGATVSLNKSAPSTLPFYVTASNVPDIQAQVTDKAGVGGAVNVPAGTVRATATYVATSTIIGTADVYVHPAELTYAWIRPRVH
jgi:hypothetical protein